MASSPRSALLSLPPVRPQLSPTKSNSFTRSTSTSASTTRGGGGTTTKRARSSSIVSVQEVPETYDDQLDQAALNNVNAEWVNYKGTTHTLSLLLFNFREKGLIWVFMI